MARARTAAASLLTEPRELPVHPLAAIFPMMSDAELGDLAEDIAENGQRQAITLGRWEVDGEEVHGVIDGRNRLAACKLIGIEPKFEDLLAGPIAAYIVSANLARRNLTKGQQAMALAMIYPEPEKGGRGKLSRDGTVSQVSKQRLSLARAVLHHSRAKAEEVLAGLSLDKAVADMEAERARARSTERLMAELQAGAPDFADLVAEERMSLDEGLAAMRERHRLRQMQIEIARKQAAGMRDFPAHALSIKAVATETGEPGLVDAALIAGVEEGLRLLREVLANEGGENEGISRP